MIIQKLNQQQYIQFCCDLVHKAYSAPLDPSYTVSVVTNQNEYLVKLQPEKENQIAVLQALLVRREEDGIHFDLLINSAQLRFLWDVILTQGIL